MSPIYHRWMAREIAFLRQNYGRLGPVACAAHFGVTSSSVAGAARRNRILGPHQLTVAKRRDEQVGP